MPSRPPTEPPQPLVEAALRHASPRPSAGRGALGDDDAWLSALCDGETFDEPGAAGLPQVGVPARVACQRWRHDETWRATWHAWHVAGDALRSDELAAHAPRDAAFLASLRTRLAGEAQLSAVDEENSPIAPSAPLAAASTAWAQPPSGALAVAGRGAASGARRWAAPMAALAGVATVAGVAVVLRLGAVGGGLDAGPGALSLAGAAPTSTERWSAPAVAAVPVSTTGAASAEAFSPARARVQALAEEARVADYLAAHRSAIGRLPVADAGGVQVVRGAP